MKVKKLLLEHDDGSIKFVEGEELAKYQDNLARCIASAKLHNVEPFKENLITWHEYAPEFKLQRVYFALIEQMAKETGAGYTKSALHAALKPMLFTYLQDNPSNFKDNVVIHSTKNLTHNGWVSMIEQLKELSQDTFGYVLQ